MSFRTLLRAVSDAEDAGQFWAAQQKLRSTVEMEERLITKRRNQASRLAREKTGYAHSQDRSIDRIRRFEELISACRWYRDRHSTRRATALYLGDALAFKLLPEHYINVLCQNAGPGFFGGKEGRKLEMQGDRALLHDLTHCLRIGDLTFVRNGFPPAVAEFESGHRHSSTHQRRKVRQHQRLKLLEKVLGESVGKGDADDLLRYSFPVGFIEQDRHFTYHTRAFEEASRLGSGGYSIVRPEQGLVYLATAADCPSAAFMPEFMSTVRPCRCEFASLRQRVEGTCPWVPPITLLPINEDVLSRYLDQEFRFYVYIDLGHVVRSLKQLGVRIKPTFDSDRDTTWHDLQGRFAGWFIFEAESGHDGSVWIGPKILHRVLFGLATLESAVAALAQAANSANEVALKASSLLE